MKQQPTHPNDQNSDHTDALSRINTWLDELFLLMQTRGQAHYGEDVSQLEHMLQCAQLAQDRQYPDTLVAAALLHDVGHLLLDHAEDTSWLETDNKHEQRGAAWLAYMLPETVYTPIALHVAAKRYRCTIDASYHASLSQASRLSLQLQGGLMSQKQAQAFRASRWFKDAMTLRELDDQAKKTDALPSSLHTYRALLTRLCLHSPLFN